MVEHFFQCPYCWEEVSMLLDSSLDQSDYIEDCEVCCNPILINYSFNLNMIESFQALSIEQ